ncbi:MAG: 5-formyltetrahydrofolate cyclo-ligase [Desulfobacterales bacterium]
MDDIQEAKRGIRTQMIQTLEKLPEDEHALLTQQVEARLFDFANFLESRIVMLYVAGTGEVPTRNIIRKTSDLGKIVVLPAFIPEKFEMKLLKIDHPERDLVPGPRGILEPNPARCKEVPIDCIDIAVIPAVALDEKGGRIGSGEGYYDRLIPDLPITTRKVALAFDLQIVPQVPMESHDKYIDIIVTEKRTIYKI